MPISLQMCLGTREIYKEQVINLMRHLRWTWNDIMITPVRWRQVMLAEIVKKPTITDTMDKFESVGGKRYMER